MINLRHPLLWAALLWLSGCQCGPGGGPGPGPKGGTPAVGSPAVGTPAGTPGSGTTPGSGVGSPGGTASGTPTGTPAGTTTGYVVGTTCTGTAPHASCVNPVDVLDFDGQPSGMVQCEDGSINRVAEVPSPTAIDGAACDPGLVDIVNCTQDAECTNGPNGACRMTTRYPVGQYFCDCLYACSVDADCGPGQVCLHPTAERQPLLWDKPLDAGLVAVPFATWGVCTTAGCSGPGDCPSGECGVSSGCGYGFGTACRDSAVDQCRADCECGPAGWDHCIASGSWGCFYFDCNQ